MRRRQIHGARPARRKLVWVDTVFAQGLVINDNLVIDLFTGLRVAGASVLGVTVIRTLVTISNTSATVTKGDGFYWGLCVTDSNDVGLNTAGAPNAHTTPNIDWAWREFRTASSSISLPVYTKDAGNVITADVRAKRKVQEMNQTWALVANQSAVGASPSLWTWYARTLVALP